MKTIMVTGGAGYVGSILVRRLLEDNYRVICVDNLLFGGDSILDVWNHPNFVFEKADLTDFEKIDRLFDNDAFFAVVHLAAIVGDPACKQQPEMAKKLNWEASKYLVEKCRDKNVSRFIFASTCSNYGKMDDPNGYVTEESALAPVSLYAELKVKFEKYILDEIPKSDQFCPTSLRFSTVYGLSPRMRFDLTVNEFTKELAMRKELIIFGEQFWRPYCHVADFSNAILTVLDAPEQKVAYNVFNVGSIEENYTKKMIVEELLKFFPEATIKYVVKNEDPRDYRVDSNKIKKELGFEITKKVPEGIKEIKDLIELGVIQDPELQKYYNIPHIN